MEIDVASNWENKILVFNKMVRSFARCDRRITVLCTEIETKQLVWQNIWEEDFQRHESFKIDEVANVKRKNLNFILTTV